LFRLTLLAGNALRSKCVAAHGNKAGT
jgi:hypothetical protein